jgi:RNA polymerase sigma factor (sigma-70 family)
MRLDVMADAQTMDDARLVELGLDGNRDAFGQLVARYQSPVCALAYSACGDISQSEDLAQQAFIIAWRKLGDLREPAMFKSWLYGITRNLINDNFRRQSRNPLAAAEPLDESLATASALSNPIEQAISKEEQGILWRSLEHIPESYREPLILFYREHQSIERVAAILDVSEEAARQRLSRGRKLLQERVIAFVEGALEQTAPRPAFTLGVLSALPGLTAAASSSVVGSAIAKGGATGKAMVSGGLLSTVLFPIIWLAGAVAGTWAMAVKLPDSSRERKFAWKTLIFCGVGSLLYVLGIYLFTNASDWDAHPQRNTAILLGSCFAYCAVLLLFWGWALRVNLRIRKEETARLTSTGYFSRFESYEYRSRRTLLGLPLVHVRFNRDLSGPPAKGWIAIGTKAYGVVFAAGAYAVGFISWGALSVGAVALGGVGIGLLAFGGVALGMAATGGGAIGYVAYGGGAIGWLGAAGGATLAHYFAVGGGAIAQHANDRAALAFMRHSTFFRYAEPFTWTMMTLSWLAPLLSVWFKRWLNRKYRISTST